MMPAHIHKNASLFAANNLRLLAARFSCAPISL